MPQVREYKKGSIIYFESEKKNTFAFLLKSGVLTRDKLSLETNSFEQSQLVLGEFFGIKGALGVLPRDETIRVARDAIVYIFTAQEFLALISKNISIIFKMMKAFSNELRHIHHAIENILVMDTDIADNNSNAGKLKNIGDYYLKKKKFSQAGYTFNRFLEYYPKHADVREVKQKLSTLSSIIGVEATPSENTTSASVPDVESISTSNEVVPLFVDPPLTLDEEGAGDEFSKSFNQLVKHYKEKNYLDDKAIILKMGKFSLTRDSRPDPRTFFPNFFFGFFEIFLFFENFCFCEILADEEWKFRKNPPNFVTRPPYSEFQYENMHFLDFLGRKVIEIGSEYSNFVF